jgi:hypothetical protein
MDKIGRTLPLAVVVALLSGCMGSFVLTRKLMFRESSLNYLCPTREACTIPTWRSMNRSARQGANALAGNPGPWNPRSPGAPERV